VATASIASLTIIVVFVLSLVAIVVGQYRYNQRLKQRLKDMKKYSSDASRRSSHFRDDDDGGEVNGGNGRESNVKLKETSFSTS